jgi:3-dehydroquinate synthetase
LPHARAGLVEALKMGALYDAALCDQVVQASATCLELGNLIHRALALKIKVCQEDPDDRGMRAALNYGHTVGHAIEAGSQYTMLHGEAVALGMVAEAQFAATQGATDATAVQLQQALRAMNMPVDWRRATLDFHALGHDKKRSGSKVTLPIVKRLGEVSLQQVALCDLEDFLRSHP